VTLSKYNDDPGVVDTFGELDVNKKLQ